MGSRLESDEAIDVIVEQLKRGHAIHTIPFTPDVFLPPELLWYKFLVSLHTNELLKEEVTL